MQKCCYICKKTLDINQFHKNKTRPDGHMAECKECAKKRAREYSRAKYGYRAWLPRISDKLKETHKQCPTCQQIKPKSMFYVTKKRNDGFSWQCKECENKRKKEQNAKKKHLSYQELKKAKIHARVENTTASTNNKSLDIIAHGVPLKDKSRKLPDNFNQDDVMDKPKVVYATVRKSK